MKHSSGYILIVTMLMVASATALVNAIFYQSGVTVSLVYMAIGREKAKLLAFSGLEVTRAQLSYVSPKPEKQPANQAGNAQKQQPPDPVKELLTRILPSLNRWQTFELREQIDGIDAELKICIMSEEGKINLNKIYDFNKHVFMGEKAEQENWKTILKQLLKKVESEMKMSNLFESLEKFLKKAEEPFDDITQLLLIPEWQKFKDMLYYQPAVPEHKGTRPLYLTDIFTLYSPTARLQPWLFSDSMLALIGFARASGQESGDRAKNVVEWLKSFKKNVNWKTDWATSLKLVYQKELQSLPKGIDSVLSTTVAPKMFSVLSKATVEGISQHIFAYIEVIEQVENGQTIYDTTIKKWYLL